MSTADVAATTAAPAVDAAAVPAAPAAPVDVEPKNVEEALEIVIRKSIEANGLIRGISQVARALDGRTALLCILAEDCEEAQYQKLIQGLCAQNNIDLVKVPERAKLAEWAGLVTRDRTGAIKKSLKCSCVAIRNFGETTRALDMLLDQIK